MGTSVRGVSKDEQRRKTRKVMKEAGGAVITALDADALQVIGPWKKGETG